MPKIIENIRENLLEEARRQVMEQGYSAMTIRSVAKACGVGVGTVYNYFSSKDMLVASFMLVDWQECITRIQRRCMSNIGAGNSRRNLEDADIHSSTKGGDSTENQNSAELQKSLVPQSCPVINEALHCIYDELGCFIAKYASLFQDEGAGATFATVFPQRHKQLRSQIAEPLQVLFQEQRKESGQTCRKGRPNVSPDFLAEFVAENMLTWTLAGRTYEEIGSILLQLF